MTIQWNPSIAATLGEEHVGHYIGVAFIEGLFCTQINCSFWDLDSWPLYRGGLYSGVAVKRGSTVEAYIIIETLTCTSLILEHLYHTHARTHTNTLPYTSLAYTH